MKEVLTIHHADNGIVIKYDEYVFKITRIKLADAIWGLSEGNEEFKTKFKQLLNETKQRFQKEFDEL